MLPERVTSFFERLEPCAVKAASTVLRGRDGSDAVLLPDWTRSLWGKDWQKPDFIYPYNPDDKGRENLNASDDVFRVLRGGSFNLHRDVARCAYRGRVRPDVRNYYIGFRVVVRSAPVPLL